MAKLGRNAPPGPASPRAVGRQPQVQLEFTPPGVERGERDWRYAEWMPGGLVERIAMPRVPAAPNGLAVDPKAAASQPSR